MFMFVGKDNQDAYISWARFWDSLHTHFFSVWDGHGINGRKVSTFLKSNLPVKIEKEIQKENLLLSTELGKHPSSEKINEILVSSFYAINDALIKSPIDVRFSGTTWWSLLIIGKRIYCANAGDSRAILVRIPDLQEIKGDRLKHTNKQGNHSNKSIDLNEEDKEIKIEIIELSRDHKPELKEELARIEKNGGEVQPYRDINGGQLGPMRVWVK
jgi:serine/threonine protein phosphatase PrpC